MSRFERWREQVREMKRDVHALYLALRDGRTPWYAKVVAVCVVAYAVSPIDLIPDPIPILGYLDDLVLVPLGIALVRRLVPPEVLVECREKAMHGGPKSSVLPWVGASVIGLLWLATALLLTLAAWRWFAGQ